MMNYTKSATISTCGLFRYELVRTWGFGEGLLALIMLNPSFADDKKDDPTVSAAVVMAKRWGFGGLIIGNLFAWRSSSPKNLRDAFEAQVAVGIDNDVHLRSIINASSQVMVGWGGEGDRYMERVKQVDHLIRHLNKMPRCIGTTNTGQPKHPLLRFHTAAQKLQASLAFWKMPQ